MSYIDSELVEKCITDASFDSLEKALKKHEYEVVRTNLQITAHHGGLYNNYHLSTITILDLKGYRECVDVETSKGYLCKPNSGVLAKIVKLAESYEKRVKSNE